MSQTQDAITKAMGDSSRGACSPSISEAEEILTSSSDAARTLNRQRTGPPVRLGSDPPLARLENWTPDANRMLFSADCPDDKRYAREQFRSLRLQLGGFRGTRASAVAVASAVSGEGKTFVAANLAHAFGILGEERVLLLDCDLRRGRLAKLVGARLTPGLSEYLLGEESLTGVLQSGFDGALHLIPSGRLVAEPGELIGGSRLQQLIVELRSMYDWIFVDTPPAEYFSDAGVVAGLCDGVLLVAAAGITPMRFAKRLLSRFRTDSIIGVVLNRMDCSEESNAYYGYEQKMDSLD